MKLSEAIEQVKKLKPNAYTDDTLTMLLNQFEACLLYTSKMSWQKKCTAWAGLTRRRPSRR